MDPLSPFDPDTVALLDDGDEEPRERRRKAPGTVLVPVWQLLAVLVLSYAIVAAVAIRVFGIGPLPLAMVAALMLWMMRVRRR